MQEKCCAKGCNRLSIYKKHKLCASHYMRYRKHGDINEEVPIQARRVLKSFRNVKDEEIFSS
jgi:hypothetical protein